MDTGSAAAKWQLILSISIAAAVGHFAWSGQAKWLGASFLFPLLTLLQPNRATTYLVGSAYYGAATWPLVPGAVTFFGPRAHVAQGVELWVTASAVLAGPWALFHFHRRPLRLWSVPLALITAVLPPIGLIGWASPLTAAGILFPGTGWLGLFAILILPSVIINRPRGGGTLTVVLVGLAHAAYPGDPAPPNSWEAVNTNFGGSGYEMPNPIKDWQNAEWIQQRAIKSAAKVIVFPETVVPHWNEAVEAFWEPTLQALRASGTTIIVGSLIAARDSQHELNALVIRGSANPSQFIQRIPVPISMWKPFVRTGMPLHVMGAGTVNVAGERPGVLMCYELLLTWPVLESVAEHPSILIGVANDYWAPPRIPAVQVAALTAWGRLFRIPKLAAVNT